MNGSTNAPSRTERNYGIDALRIVSMLMIVIIHLLGQGGISESTVGVKHSVVALIDVFVVCAVDIYAIISGYVGYREDEQKIKSSKFIALWAQVFFYSVGISFLAMFLFPAEIGLDSVIKSCFPVLTKCYWYFSAYTVVFFLTPWLNKLIRSLNKTQLTKLVCVLVGLFSVLTVATYSIDSDPFTLDGGYSAIWLLVLYVVGAWLKKNEVLYKLSKTKLTLLLWGGIA